MKNMIKNIFENLSHKSSDIFIQIERVGMNYHEVIILTENFTITEIQALFYGIEFLIS